MKKVKLALAALTLSAVMVFPAYAGEWKQEGTNWKYQNDDGSFATSTWQWIDGNKDGIAESYCFNDKGILFVNTTTPDNYTVDANGAWIVNGVVQTQAVSTSSAPAQTQNVQTTTTSNTGISSSAYDGYTIVVNTNTKKYHTPSCSSVKDIKAENLGYSSDAAYLESQGYAACKKCH